MKNNLDTLAWMVSLIGFAVSVGVWQHSASLGFAVLFGTYFIYRYIA
jgi:hypothetical protein